MNASHNYPLRFYHISAPRLASSPQVLPQSGHLAIIPNVILFHKNNYCRSVSYRKTFNSSQLPNAQTYLNSQILTLQNTTHYLKNFATILLN